MEIIDLSRELFHRCPVHPSHPPVIISTWYDHSEKKKAGETVFSSKALSIAFSDHAGTHIDAPAHFDPDPGAASVDEMPLDQFYTFGICLDLSHIALRHSATASELEAARAKAGQVIHPGDAVLLHMGTNDRLLGTPGYLHDFPGLATDAVDWLADAGVKIFGVEAVSPAPEGEPNFKAHLACARRKITHIEGLAHLDKVVGRGRFRFVCFPLRIRGGTASPIRAVAIFE